VHTYLISHVNSKGTGVAQAAFRASKEANAKAAFEIAYPDREISTIGIRGQG
jgi:hypothetical protein